LAHPTLWRMHTHLHPHPGPSSLMSQGRVRGGDKGKSTRQNEAHCATDLKTALVGLPRQISHGGGIKDPQLVPAFKILDTARAQQQAVSSQHGLGSVFFEKQKKQKRKGSNRKKKCPPITGGAGSQMDQKHKSHYSGLQSTAPHRQLRLRACQWSPLWRSKGGGHVCVCVCVCVYTCVYMCVRVHVGRSTCCEVTAEGPRTSAQWSLVYHLPAVATLHVVLVFAAACDMRECSRGRAGCRRGLVPDAHTLWKMVLVRPRPLTWASTFYQHLVSLSSSVRSSQACGSWEFRLVCGHSCVCENTLGLYE
jgi:hypothetical protein